jgi:hypothetical protein
MIVPPLTTLFSNSARQSLSDIAPVFGAELMNIFRQFFVFLLTPWSFHHWWIQDFLPPMQTLNICPLIEMRSNSLPVLSTVFLHQLCQLVVFFGVPVPFVVLWVLVSIVEIINVLLCLGKIIFFIFFYFILQLRF